MTCHVHGPARARRARCNPRGNGRRPSGWIHEGARSGGRARRVLCIPCMTFDYVAGAALAVLLTGYLLYALLWPERF